MARLVKILLILIAAIVGVGVLASIALFLFFDPNDFRDNISTGVKKATGRDLVIEGDLSLSIFPWIAVEIGRTRLGNAEGFGSEPFLSFEQARLSVRLLPLILRQEISVGTASLDSLVVNLQVDKNGVTNWDDLTDTEQAPEEDADEPAGDAVMPEVANIVVTNANVTYTDAAAGSSSSISGLTVETGRIAVGSPFDFGAEFEFESKPGDIGGDLSISGTLLASNGMAQFDISDLNLSGTLRGIAEQATEFNFDARAISIDTEGQNVTLGEMDMGILGISMAANVAPFSYAGDPHPKATITVHEFSLKELMATLGTEPPATADPNALQRLSFSADAAVGSKAISLTGMQLKMDDTTMVGSLSLPTTPDGAIVFDLKVDSIVLDHYMAPASETEDAVASDEDANIEIPVDMIRALNANGKLTMDTALLSGIEFENLELGLNSANGKLRMHPISAEVFDGAYKGDIRIDASGDIPAISVNENIVDVQMSSLSKAMYGLDNVSGSINGSFVLSGRGADMNAIRQDLDGNISFALADGEWQGTDIWYEIRKARATLKQEPAPEPRLPPRTEFTSVAASGVVTNGVLQNDDLIVELPFLRLTGRGKVNFVEANLDYRMDARVVESPELAGELSAAELKDFTSVVIPLKISGPLASPSIVPDFEVLLKREVEKQIEKEKDKLIDRLLGIKREPDDAEQADGEPQEEGQEEQDEEQKAEDLIKDALKNLFKD
jgi:AsmA protein